MKTTLLGLRFLARNPRLSIALPEGMMAALERWAEAEGNRPTSLATFLLEKAIREAIEAGKIPPAKSEPPQSSDLVDLKTFLMQLAFGELPTNEQLTALAQSLEVPPETLIQIRNQLQKAQKKSST